MSEMEAATATVSKLSMNSERDRRILSVIKHGVAVYHSEIITDPAVCSMSSDTIARDHILSLAGQGHIFKDHTDKYYLSESGEKYLAELNQGVVQQTINGEDSELPCPYGCGGRFKARGMANHVKSCPNLLELESRERLADKETIDKLTNELTDLRAAQNLPPSEIIKEASISGDAHNLKVSGMGKPIYCRCLSQAGCDHQLKTPDGWTVCDNLQAYLTCPGAENKDDTPEENASKDTPGYPSEAVQTPDSILSQMTVDYIIKVISDWNLSGDLSSIFIEAHGTPTADPLKDRAIMLDWARGL